MKFTGQATIMPGWYAGYVLQIEADEHDPLFIHSEPGRRQPVLAASGVNVLQSFWFIKSDHLGKVSIGKQSAAG